MYLENYGFGSIFRRIFELASLCKGQKSSNITFRFSFKVFKCYFVIPLLFFSYFKVLFDFFKSFLSILLICFQDCAVFNTVREDGPPEKEFGPPLKKSWIRPWR